ncbi:hypothetical protein LF41_1610 [Lysobacter dokdonensis DS-58]|uniref:YaiO family outer membrane beta-barrel protein n=1 Tax=Lysobacter dokdonensis DS-58 TaxID=1300345 RepID=A0A0A2WJ18_9GAMM|nr:TorF family putative porin [Lysobacter dokdonensis]KGQ18255.1 hypothetical protein LF41_1610 [Lysobacter dokdonensis DS-58]
MRNARDRNRRRLRCACAALAACCAWSAHAQVSGSVGVVSDYRYRGYSLSGGDAAVQASVAHDWAQGAYAGLFASSAEYAGDSGAQWIPYAGWARRDEQGRSWDVGVRYSHFTADTSADYVELHAGLALRRVSLRVHYAPDYFGQVSNWYVEADGSVPFGDRVQWLWHAGVTRSGESDYRAAVYPASGGYSAQYATYVPDRTSEDRTRIDVRTGVSLVTRVCDVQLTWQHVDGDDATPYAAPFDARDRAGWVLGCMHRW